MFAGRTVLSKCLEGFQAVVGLQSWKFQHFHRLANLAPLRLRPRNCQTAHAAVVRQLEHASLEHDV